MGFLDKLLRRNVTPTTREIAKERLQTALASDRTNITPILMETLKDELISTLSKHVAIDESGIQVTLAKGEDYHRIVAEIPVLRPREAAARGATRQRKPVLRADE